MKPVDVGATVGADGVEIKLPRLRVVVERRQAERLRDALFAVLPKASEQTPPTGEPCAYCAGTGYGPGGLPQEPRLHLLSIAGDVEPELHGPFSTEAIRDDAARLHRKEHGDEDGLFRVDATGNVEIASFTGAEVDEWEAR